MVLKYPGFGDFATNVG